MTKKVSPSHKWLTQVVCPAEVQHKGEGLILLLQWFGPVPSRCSVNYLCAPKVFKRSLGHFSPWHSHYILSFLGGGIERATETWGKMRVETKRENIGVRLPYTGPLISITPKALGCLYMRTHTVPVSPIIKCPIVRVWDCKVPNWLFCQWIHHSVKNWRPC